MSGLFKKYLFPCCVLVFVLVSLGVFARLYNVSRNTPGLEQVLAETDRLDPDWRLEDLQSGFPALPDEENSALVVFEIAKQIPQGGPDLETRREGSGNKSLFEELITWPQEKQFDEWITLELQSALGKVSTAVQKAELLADRPQGCFPLHWSLKNLSGSGGIEVDHEQDPLPTTKLLTTNALLKTQQGDIEGAMLSCAAAVNASRCFGEHLSMNSFLKRSHCLSDVDRTLERVLAQGEPSDGALEQLQKLIEKELSLPLLVNTIRLERALRDTFQLAAMEGKAGDSIIQPQANIKWRMGMLNALNNAQVIAQLPLHEHLQRLREERLREKQTLRTSPLTRLGFQADSTIAWVHVDVYMNKFQVVHESYLCHLTRLNATLAAIAMERYRRSHGRWPANLQDLVPRFLKQVPRDPFIDDLMQLHPVEDGLIVYFMGVIGKDNLGKLTETHAPGTWVCFRLWNETNRRQPAQ